MGFLSKLFGGDAGAPPSKSAGGAPSSSTELESAVAVRTPVKQDEAAPSAPKPVTPEAAPIASSADAAPARARAPAAPASSAGVVRPAEAPASSVEPSAEVARRAAPARVTSAAKQAKSAADAALMNLEPPASSAAVPNPPAAVPPSTAEAPRRARVAESSIITSAPALGEPPPRAPAPRPGVAAKPKDKAASADPNAPRERAPMSSLSGESGLLAASRTRKDRSKSPGFYSSVNSTASQSHLKRTVVGVAPPPDIGAAGPQSATLAEPEKRAAEACLGADDAAARAATGPALETPVLEATPQVSPETAERPKHEVVRAPVSAAPTAPLGEGEEKEETSPGLGFTPSRHDPALRAELPERDLELLVDFVMDLGLGLASEAWFGAAREAALRLMAAASKLQRNGLEKALGQLSHELDSPNAQAEERRARILQQLVLVDLALPRPVDVPGRRLVRERLIVQHLIAELAGSAPRVAQYLRDEGGSSLERLARLGPEELAGRADVSAAQAEQALATFRDYLAERARRGPSLALLGKARVLEQLLRELSSAAEEFERSADDDDPSVKREARKKRQAAITRLSLFLAECGEAGILGEIERSSVQGKIARLERWLNELPPSSARVGERELPRQGTIG